MSIMRFLTTSSLAILLSITSLAISWAQPCLAADFDSFHLLDLDQFSMEYWKTANNRDPYWPYQDPKRADGEHWRDGAAAIFNLDLLSFDEYKLYWDNRVHMDNTNAQVRQVGWEWEAGLSVPKLDVFYHHHSQHLLDADSNYRFPLENKYGVRFNFYQRER